MPMARYQPKNRRDRYKVRDRGGEILRERPENVIFSVSHTDISHAMRLSSVWPINFQYDSRAAATGYSSQPPPSPLHILGEEIDSLPPFHSHLH